MRIRLFVLVCALTGATSSAHASDPDPQAKTIETSPFGATGTEGGFFLSSKPRLSPVFGDTASYRSSVDRFFDVLGQMQAARAEYTRHVQTLISSLASHQATTGRRAACPEEAVALPYLQAFRLGQQYHDLGKELERERAVIVDMDSLGETAGLTPDYRWKVERAETQFQAVLTDFREMKASFESQLAPELAHVKCEQTALMQKGTAMEEAGLAALVLAPAVPEMPRRMAKKTSTTPVYAASATFSVDNASCKKPLAVFLDGKLAGEVPGGDRVSFQTSVGRHSLCLLDPSSERRCGDPGTLRQSYVHDGWSIALRCD